MSQSNSITQLDRIILQYRAEIKHGLNELASGRTPEEQLENQLLAWSDARVLEGRIDELERNGVDDEVTKDRIAELQSQATNKDTES